MASFDDHDPSSSDLDPSFEIEADGLGVDLVLLDEDASGKRFLGVVLQDGHRGLQDMGPMSTSSATKWTEQPE